MISANHLSIPKKSLLFSTWFFSVKMRSLYYYLPLNHL